MTRQTLKGAPRKTQALMVRLEEEIMLLLNKHEGLTVAEKLKAIEAGARVLAIRHKITEDEVGTDGSFFAGK